MALFATAEEKEEKRKQKELEQLQKLIEKYNLDNLEKEDLKNLKAISDEMLTNNLFKTGLALSFAKSEDQAKIGYLSVLVEQNWLIIRQLANINRKLNK